jgi:hypothetical protein
MWVARGGTGTPLIGKVWPGFTAWTDYYHPNSDRYWETQLKGFLNTVPVDGTISAVRVQRCVHVRACVRVCACVCVCARACAYECAVVRVPGFGWT